ncbi:MAG: bifunctional diaminohydroxyphosphoribosylaminopyrimidine deaminase/5-amino-6-(5-phosphoribosylamino)uracil reductase RibD, partial [Bacteroidales bacterium]|nr:bifunctional diaminohydroxyphosphoribosylaminopyrimidine deaminase/5-amino-6-(5-phosphoribosylamino)uracil reductase RibD [Bacteroidales bacterium]
MRDHEIYMRRCLELARNGQGNVAPNPMVGSVIVHHDRIIGEGFHQKYGGPHAEVNAINSVKDQELLKTSTLFVNLEPCAHHGKTPPCSDLIIEKKIPKVVIGCQDSFEQVSGKGIEKMRKAGIEVIVGVLEEESLHLNRRFFTFHQKKRPYVILKWAETIDGYIDIDRSSGDKGISWITHPYLRIPVH